MSDLHRIVSYGQFRERLDRLVAGGEETVWKAGLVVGAILLAVALVAGFILCH